MFIWSWGPSSGRSPAAEEGGSGAGRSPSGTAKWVRAAHTVLLPWAHLTPQQKGWAAKQPPQWGLPCEQQAQTGRLAPDPTFLICFPKTV